MAKKPTRAEQLARNMAAGEKRINSAVTTGRRAIAGTVEEFTSKRNFLTSASARSKLYSELADQYSVLNSSVDDWVESEVNVTSKNFWNYAKKDLPAGAVSGTFGAFSEKYVEDIVGRINPSTITKQVGVNSQLGGMLARDIRTLRAAVSTTIAEGAVEGLTNAQMAARMKSKVAGAVGQMQFLDKAGRKWTADNYFGMLNRTLHANAARESYIDTATKEAGFDLYVIAGGVTGSSADNPDDPCDQWAGRIISMTGSTPGYPTYADAIAAGVFHVNCTHFVRVVTADEIAAAGPPAAAPVPPEATPPKVDPFVPATSIKEAEAYARDTIGVEYVSFKGLDLQVANDMNRATQRMKTLMPSLETNGIGSAQAANKAMKAEVTALFKKSPQYDYYLKNFGQVRADKAVASYANRSVGRVGPGTIAWSTGRDSINMAAAGTSLDVRKYKGVFVSTKYGKKASIIDDVVSQGEKSGWFTKDAKGIGHIMSHEYGHEIDKTINFSRSPSFMKIYKREHAKGIASVTSDLSEYGATAGGKAAHKPAEMVAEAWAEFTMSPTPRRLAREIGDEMLSAYHASQRGVISTPLDQWKTEVLRSIGK